MIQHCEAMTVSPHHVAEQCGEYPFAFSGNDWRQVAPWFGRGQSHNFQCFCDVGHARLLLFLVDLAGGAGDKNSRYFQPPRAVEVDLRPLLSDTREAAHSSAGGPRNRLVSC